MRAAVVREYNQPVSVEEYPDPDPGPDDVIVEPKACGVCGSDLFLIKGGFDSTLPIVPGHEASGTVVEVGSNVTGVEVGTLVALYYIDFCGRCDLCKSGRVNLCLEVRRMGVDFDGAFAERVRLPAVSVIPVEPSDDPAAIAVLTDAVGTPYHALVHVARVERGETVVVFGVGGLGSNAVQLARHFGCRVVAVTRSEQKQELARTLGADDVIGGGPDAVDEMKRLLGPRGPEVVIQTVGSPVVDRQAVETAGLGGRVVLVGASVDPFELRSTELIWREAAVMGSRGFLPDDIRAVIDLYREGSISVDHLLETQRPLSEIGDALDDLKNGTVLRSVIRSGESW
jgi:propanol-preferring alcohol dehydrogenase